MICNMSTVLNFCAIFCLVIPAYTEVLQVPSQSQIPSLFESAASSYSLSKVDLNSTLPVYPQTIGTDIQLDLMASHSCFGNGSFSVYGKDNIRSGEKRFDFGSHQLFFHNTIGNCVLGVGAGYDYDGENDIKIDETVIMNGSIVSDKNRYLYINDWEENTFFGNVNGSVHINDKERLLFGVETAHTIKDGVEYRETTEYSTDMFLGFQDNITCFNYGNGAYRNRLAAGVGLLREYMSKRGYERLRFASLKYQQSIEHSDVSLIDGVRSYFFSSGPDNIQFSGKNNKSRSIVFDVLLSERFPDKIYLQHDRKKTVEIFPRFVKFTLQYEENRKSILSINQWNMNDVYYGVNERKSKHYPLSIMTYNVTDCIFLRKFRVRFDSHLDGIIERYPNGMVEGECVLICTPALGCTLPIRDIALLDINYFLFPVTTGYKGNNHSFNFGLDVSFSNVLQLRVVILK